MGDIIQSEHSKEDISRKTGIPKVCQGLPFTVEVNGKTQLIKVSMCERVCVCVWY